KENGNGGTFVIEFISSRWEDILFRSYQHTSLVLQSVILATVIAILLAVVVTRYRALAPVANAISAVGLTIPSFALIGLVIPLVGIGTVPAVIVVVFYAVLPILRNTVVGLQEIDPTVLEAAKGQGMQTSGIFWRVRMPLAWPVIITGIRVATQMSMGVAAIAAYVLGPGLGGYIFTGLAPVGGANAMNYALVGTIGIIILAILVDAVLAVIARITTSKGIRA